MPRIKHIFLPEKYTKEEIFETLKLLDVPYSPTNINKWQSVPITYIPTEQAKKSYEERFDKNNPLHQAILKQLT